MADPLAITWLQHHGGRVVAQDVAREKYLVVSRVHESHI